MASKRTSGPANMDAVVRTGAADFPSADFALNAYYTGYQNWWTTNPNPSANWLTSQIGSTASPNIGVKSRLMVAWSTTDKTANVTLSGGNLTATFAAGQGGVRCDTSFAGGKLYYEIYQTTGGAVSFFGWANAAAVFTVNSMGGSPPSAMSASPGRGTVVFNGSTLGQSLDCGDTGSDTNGTLCIAIDFTAKLFWVRVAPQEAGGYWNNSITADPATGTGGYSLATIGAGPYFPMFSANGAGAVATARFGASNMLVCDPRRSSSTWILPVQNFAATVKFGSAALLQPPRAASLQARCDRAPQAAASCYKMVGYAILRPEDDSYPPSRSATDRLLRGVRTWGNVCS